MNYNFLIEDFDRESLNLPESAKINHHLLQNNQSEIIKALDFLNSDDRLLHIHGFLGTGKRQFVNYVEEFLSNDVIKLEYYCKSSTVCDDILLNFNNKIEQISLSKSVNFNAKITTLSVKFLRQLNSIKKPFIIVLHSIDEVLNENVKLISNMILEALRNENVKIIITTKAMNPEILTDIKDEKKIFLKAFTKDIFVQFLNDNGLEVSGKLLEDFYSYTRGYYYYTALSVKIIQAMQINLSEFLQKYTQSGMSFDSFLGVTYINIIPSTIRNFFWFLRTMRHGLTLNALAVLEIYDEFSIEYLKNNLMVFQDDETIYVQDYFIQKIDISIPPKTEIKLHKYIVGIYEKQLKENLDNRIIMISRQAMRAEIEYHNQCIKNIENGNETAENKPSNIIDAENSDKTSVQESQDVEKSISDKIESVLKLVEEKKYTDAIEYLKNILDSEEVDLRSINEIRLNLAKLYKQINDFNSAIHYYSLVEAYYKQNNEVINLNYLYYDMTEMYFSMYNIDRAVEIIKQVIYSVDTPQSLMVKACTLLGNIYSEIKNSSEAYSYYKKAIESLDENTENVILAELYFKFALVNDDNGDISQAFEYYNKCIATPDNDLYKSSAYSNLASCYLENENYSDAKECFLKAYKIEKDSNNFEGIYYNAFNLAKILVTLEDEKALDYFLEAEQSAEFINDDLYILELSIALGDYYYNIPSKMKDALKKYYKALNIVEKNPSGVDISVIQKRIDDMRLRMNPEDFEMVESKYARKD